jgi:type II secretory pathway pseudopilin PulG
MIVIGIIGLLIVAAMPNLLNSQKRAKRGICLMNIEQIEGAKQQWVLNEKKKDTDTPSEDDLKSYLKDNKFPDCPAGGTYSINAVDTKCTCSLPEHAPK